MIVSPPVYIFAFFFFLPFLPSMTVSCGLSVRFKDGRFDSFVTFDPGFCFTFFFAAAEGFT